MKLIKGSAAAKSFMKKLRASKGKPKKKLSGSKHTDIKSHNYKITIGAAGDYAKFEISTIKALAKLVKKPIKVVQKAVYDDKHLLDLISNSFDTGKTPAQTAKLLKAHLLPKKEAKPLNAFVNLLTKKGKGQGSGGTSKANFPMKLPAMVTIGALNKNHIENLKERLNFDETLTMFLDDLRFQLKNKSLTIAQKNAIKKHITVAKKQMMNNRKQIAIIKKSI